MFTAFTLVTEPLVILIGEVRETKGFQYGNYERKAAFYIDYMLLFLGDTLKLLDYTVSERFYLFIFLVEA